MSHPFTPVTTTKIRQSEKRHARRNFYRVPYSLLSVITLSLLLVSIAQVFLFLLFLFIDGGG